MTTLEDLVAMLEGLGRRPSCEGAGLTELDHLLQCAHELTATAPDDVGLQLAGLVHDVGHVLGPDAAHGTLGAAFVRPVLGDRVATLVADHVPAKRYLVAVVPEYRAGLSPDSVRTLELQGGPMTPDEVARFRRTADADAAVLLRRADDAAKVPGRVVPGLDHWLEVLAGGAAAVSEGIGATDSVAGVDRERRA